MRPPLRWRGLFNCSCHNDVKFLRNRFGLVKVVNTLRDRGTICGVVIPLEMVIR